MATTRIGSGRATRRMMAALAVSAAMAVTMAACATNNDPGIAAGSGQTPGPSPAPAVTTTVAPSTTTTMAPTAANVATATNATFGTILVDGAGKTLYTFDKDTGGVSACTGGCASLWPPVVLSGGTTTPAAGPGVTNLTAVVRPDDPAKMQVAFNGKPLYTYTPDAAPGETKGDGVANGAWHVAKAS